MDGVPKALDILHKEKTCQLVKAVTKKDVGQVTRTSQKITVNGVTPSQQIDTMILEPNIQESIYTTSVCGCDSQYLDGCLHSPHKPCLGFCFFSLFFFVFCFF